MWCRFGSSDPPVTPVMPLFYCSCCCWCCCCWCVHVKCNCMYMGSVQMFIVKLTRINYPRYCRNDRKFVDVYMCCVWVWVCICAGKFDSILGAKFLKLALRQREYCKARTCIWNSHACTQIHRHIERKREWERQRDILLVYCYAHCRNISHLALVQIQLKICAHSSMLDVCIRVFQNDGSGHISSSQCHPATMTICLENWNVEFICICVNFVFFFFFLIHWVQFSCRMFVESE